MQSKDKDMLSVLGAWREQMCSPGPTPGVSGDELNQVKERCVVALPAGGEGSRLRHLTQGEDVQKAALRLAEGDSLIVHTIKMYRDAGLKDFVALVCYKAKSVMDELEDGERLGVRIRYSEDPDHPVGRGGAVRNAVENGCIASDATLIVHNPDDQIVNYPGCFVDDVLAGHLQGSRQGMLATIVVVPETSYAYTGLRIVSGKVTGVATYPPIPVPCHIGVTVLAPETFPMFSEMFDLSKKVDFEGVLFPRLVEESRLYSVVIPPECWIAVNDLKGVKKFVEAVGAQKTGGRPSVPA
jgi:NDP-sugar pyrophosphorylase family protein